MTTSSRVSLLIVATLGVAAGMVHLFLPGGLPVLFEKLAAQSPRTPAAAPPARKAAAPPPSGETELRRAERAYDAGDLSQAVELFIVARADADPEFRERAARGLRKAILACALTAGAAPPSPLPDDPDGEVARRQAEAERAPGERAWFETLTFAAGCGSRRKLPYLAQQAIACATPGGPVETRLRSVLATGVPHSRLLADAMLEMGIGPDDPVALAERPRPAPRGPARASLSPPSGKFTPAMRARLAEAVDLETKGTAEYDQTGPDNANRKEHRKRALDYLKEARDIYEAALEEDPASRSLDRRMHDVMEMISHLRKETNLGD